MKKIVPGIVVLIVAVILLLNTCESCKTQAPCVNLKDRIGSLIPNHFGDDCLTDEVWKNISDSIKLSEEEKACLNLCDSSGNLDRARVKQDFGLENCKQLNYKVYFEASGSMFSYESDKTSDLRSNCQKLLVNLSDDHPSKPRLFYMNDDVYEMTSSSWGYDQIVGHAGMIYKPPSSNPIPGDQGKTLFKEGFEKIIRGLNENELAIVVSDLTYSASSDSKDKTGQTNPEIVQSGANTMTKLVFQEFDDRYSILVVKWLGDYDGVYYDFRDVKHTLTDATRPYYFFIIGTNDAMSEFLFSTAKHAEESRLWSEKKYYKGFQNYYLFKSYPKTACNYRWLSQTSDCTGSKRNDHIENLTGRGEGNNAFYVAVNFRDVYAGEEYLQDISNYDVGKNSEFTLVEIMRDTVFCNKFRLEPDDKREWDNIDASHVLKLTLDVPSASDNTVLEIKLKQKNPQWFKDTSSPNDIDVKAPGFEKTTFAFKELMGGISEAYYGSTEPTIKHLTFKFKK